MTKFVLVSAVIIGGIVLGTVLQRPLLFLLLIGAIPGAVHLGRWCYAWFAKPSAITFEMGTATVAYGQFYGRGREPVMLPLSELESLTLEFVQRAAGQGQIAGKFRIRFADNSFPALRGVILEIARISSLRDVKENRRVVMRMIAQLEGVAVMMHQSRAADLVVEDPEAARQRSTLVEIHQFTSFDDLSAAFRRPAQWTSSEALFDAVGN